VELKQFVALEERPETYSLPTISARVQIGCMDAAKVQNAVGDSLIAGKCGDVFGGGLKHADVRYCTLNPIFPTP